MQEIKGNVWDHVGPETWLGVTINSYVKNSGELVMGAGQALEVKQKFPELPKILASRFGGTELVSPALVQTSVVFLEEFRVFTFPTKLEYWKPSTAELIERSCIELKGMIQIGDLSEIFTEKTKFLLVRPGCGRGGLPWGTSKRVLNKYFADEPRLVIVDRIADE